MTRLQMSIGYEAPPNNKIESSVNFLGRFYRTHSRVSRGNERGANVVQRSLSPTYPAVHFTGLKSRLRL